MPARRILFSAQKNEGPFLLEWVAYHRLIGFDEIVVYSNDCTDYSDSLLGALAEAGWVKHERHFPNANQSPQMEAVRAFMRSGFVHKGDWFCWLDLDEFLWVEDGAHRLDDLHHVLGKRKGIFLSWRMMGDSGNQVWTGRHISPDFFMGMKTGHSLKRKRGVNGKSYYCFDREYVREVSVHRPRLHGRASFDLYPFMRGTGSPMPERFYDPHVYESVFYETGDWYRHGAILHFGTRTADLYKLKNLRGNGAGPKARKFYKWDESFYQLVNTNHLPVRGQHVFTKEVSATIALMLESPKVRAAADQVYDLMRHHVPDFKFPESLLLPS